MLKTRILLQYSQTKSRKIWLSVNGIDLVVMVVVVIGLVAVVVDSGVVGVGSVGCTLLIFKKYILLKTRILL